MIERKDIREQLLQFVSEELLGGDAIESDESLLADGMIDSLGMMRLVAFVQETSGITVPPQDLTIENFRTIDAISDYIGGDA